MLTAHAAEKTKPTRRSHDPDAPYLVPPIASRHRDPIICELRDALVRLYFRRSQLQAPFLNRHGDIVVPAFGELLRRPQDHTDECLRRRGCRRFLPCDCPRPPDFFRRRSDGMESAIRVLLVLASCCDWNTMELFDPRGGYLSVSRIAELAELPCRFVEHVDCDPRPRYRMDTAERAPLLLRTARILAFTQQHREMLEDGRHTSTAPALRKLSVNFFRKWGGKVAPSSTSVGPSSRNAPSGGLRGPFLLEPAAISNSPAHYGTPSAALRHWHLSAPLPCKSPFA